MIELHTLQDGRQTAGDIASLVAGFISEAQDHLDVALYDFALSPQTAAVIVGAFKEAANRGVHSRLLYNVDHARPIAVPPPPRTDPDLIAACGAEVKPISGIPDLMHHKFMIRDGAAIWTGSTNWTEDSWTREENIIVTVASEEIAAAYTRDFEGLWASGNVADSGEEDPTSVDVDGKQVRAAFCPGGGHRIAHRIASGIGRARTRVRVCSPVITAGPILGTLAEVAKAGKVDLAGVYDGTQMHEVIGQWRDDLHAGWKIPCFESLIAQAPFGAKTSTPYRPGSTHDFMHAKITVIDDTSFVGSYNLSHSGQGNAENVLQIEDPGLADRLVSFIDGLRLRYPRVG